MSRQIRTFAEIEKDLRAGLDSIEQQVGKAFHPTSRGKRYLKDIQRIESQWRIDGAQSLIKEKSLPTLLTP